MEVRCKKCGTACKREDIQALEQGKQVKCAVCKHVLRANNSSPPARADQIRSVLTTAPMRPAVKPEAETPEGESSAFDQWSESVTVNMRVLPDDPLFQKLIASASSNRSQPPSQVDSTLPWVSSDSLEKSLAKPTSASVSQSQSLPDILSEIDLPDESRSDQPIYYSEDGKWINPPPAPKKNAGKRGLDTASQKKANLVAVAVGLVVGAVLITAITIGTMRKLISDKARTRSGTAVSTGSTKTGNSNSPGAVKDAAAKDGAADNKTVSMVTIRGGSPGYDWYMQQAQRQKDQKRPALALELYQKAAELQPQSAQPLTGKAFCLLSIEQRDQAIATFTEALKLDPRYPEALEGMAEAYQKKGDSKLAIEYYQKFLEEAPDGPLASTAQNNIAKLKQR